MGRIYDVMKIWNERGTKVSGRSLPGGHNLQEDVPDMVLEEAELHEPRLQHRRRRQPRPPLAAVATNVWL